jgi:hypothetical protein
MTSPDPHGSNGFTHGDGYTVFANPSTLPNTGSGSAPGSDFDGWDWTMIEASIVGVAAVMNPGPDVTAQALEVSDPQTLFDAATTFYTAQQNLQVVAQAVKDQTEALAGTNGPWQGQAATQFHDTLLSLSNEILGQANQLSGGSSGNGNVPNQLVNNGDFLQWAKSTIMEIDYYYAAQAIARGSKIGNNAHIEAQPDLKAQMTSDMLDVAKQLAQNYELTINSVVVPTGITFTPPNTTNGNGNGLGNINIPNPPPFPAIPPPPPFPAIPPPPPVTVSPPSIPPPPLAANLPSGLGNLSAGAPGGGGSLAPFPGDLTGPGAVGSGGLNGPAGNLPPGVGNLSAGAPGGGGSLAPFPGSLNAPGSANDQNSPNGSSAGLTNFPAGNVPTGADLSQLGGPGAAGLGNLNGPAGVGGLGNSGLNGLGSASPGSLNPNALTPTNFAAGGSTNAGALSPGLQGPATGASQGGVPFLPPGMGGAGGAGAGNQGTQRPDSAGLLGGVSQPWQDSALTGTGDPQLLQDTPSASPASWADGVGVPASAPTPGEAVGLPAASGNGAPPIGEPLIMPGMGGAAGAGAGDHPAERPDSAGLLGGVAEPWYPGLVGNAGDLGDSEAPAPGLPTPWAFSADAVAMAGPDALVAMAGPDVPADRAGGLIPGGPAMSWARGETVPSPPPVPALDGLVVEPVIPVSGIPAVGTPRMPTDTGPAAEPQLGPEVLSAVSPGLAEPGGTVPAESDGRGPVELADGSPIEPDGPGPGRLAVVRFPQGKVDTSAWSLGAAEFLSMASGIAGTGSREGQKAAKNNAPASAPGSAETERELESSGLTVYRRRRAGEGADVVEELLPTCSAGPPPGPGLTAGQQEASVQEPGSKGNGGKGAGDSDDDDDDDDFTVADLLNQDASAWGRRGLGSSGVIE